MLEIRLLGQFGAYLDGKAVDLPSRPAQALLANLALNAPRRQPRERLAGLLWPDADDDAARQGLRNALWKLKAAIGEAVLAADKLAVGFAADAAWRCDALDLLAADEATASDEALAAALAGYAGELLPGFYDEWVAIERERLSAAFERKVAALVARHEAAGRWPEVLDWSERWLARAGASEPAFRAMMRAQAGLGDRAGVGAIYRRCVAALDEDLGMPPSEATTALYQGLLDGAGAAPPAARPVGAAAVQGPAFLREAGRYEPPPRPAAREAELAALATALDAAVAGQGRVVLLSGEAGEGKSTLLAALTDLALARHPDVVVARGGCDAFAGEGRAFGPFAEAFRILAGDVEAGWAAGRIPTPLARRLWALVPHAVDAAYGRARPLLGALLDGTTLARHAAAYAAEAPVPQLAAFTAMVGSQAGPAGRLDQVALFDACAEFLAALAAARPIVLLIDDLHWMDASSAGLLLHLARRLQGLPLLLVGAFRPEEAAADGGAPAPLATVLGELQRTLGQAPLALGAREGEAARAFVDALLDREPNDLPAGFRAELARRTGGHALFTVELLDELKERGVVVRDATGRWTLGVEVAPAGLPARIEGVLQSRFGRLDDELRRALTIGAVEGEEFTAEAVARVAGGDAWRLLERLASEAGRRHRLVDELGPVRVQGRRLARFRFRHNLFQRFLYDGLGPSVRAHLHEAVADALVALHGDEAAALAVALGRHYLEAGLPGRALPHLVAAGRAANRVAAHQEARGHLEAALAALADAPPGPARDALELDARLELMVALHVTAGFAAPALATHGERAVALAEAADDAERRFRALWNLWLHHAGRMDVPASEAAVAALLAAAAGDRDRLLQAHHAAWSGCHQTGEVTAARAHLAEGAALYDEARHGALIAAYGGHDPGVCRLCYAARMDLLEGANAQARARVAEALALAERLGHAYGVAQAMVVRVEVAVWAGDFAGAVVAADEAKAYTEREGFPFWGWFAALSGGWARAWLGDPAGLATIRAFGAAFEQTPGAGSSTRFAHEASACLALGLPAEGQAAVEAGFAAAERGGERASLAELHRLRAELARLAGAADPAALEADYERAAAIAEGQGAPALGYRAAEALADLWAGGPREAEGQARLAAARARLPEAPPAGFMTAARRPAPGLTPTGG